ncbi:MAG: hypothetical protein AAFP08_01940 [Bacteroidota bacterium]
MRHLYLLLITVFAIQSCQGPDPLQQLQGTYSASSEAIAEFAGVNEEDRDGGLSGAMLDRVIENAVFEIEVLGDSIHGLFFFGGESNLINRKIIFSGDTAFITIEGTMDPSELYLINTESGIVFANRDLSSQMTLSKLEREGLSSEVRTAIASAIEEEKAEKEFRESLGVWQTGVFIDDFGDEVDGEFIYTIIEGEKTDDQRFNVKPVYVRASIQEGTFWFKIFDETLSYIERMPDREYGAATFKKQTGEVVESRVFYFDDMISESQEENAIVDHLLNNPDEIRVRIDLGDANRYMDEVYQFAISQNNLLDLVDLGD